MANNKASKKGTTAANNKASKKSTTAANNKASKKSTTTVNNKASKKSTNQSSIVQSDSEIIMQEMSITLTDEKMKGILMHTYERAVKDVSKWHFYKLYGSFLSIGGTLLLTILTSSFNDILMLKAETIKNISVAATIAFLLTGFICLAISVNQKKKNDMDARDRAIEEVFKEYAAK